MCGIVGLIGLQEDSWIDAMNDVVVHRGPDGRGTFRDRSANVSLAMQRLAIIDAEDGQQPMSSLDGRYTIVFNGEIFNAPELRRGLERDGVRFVTGHSDTEVLLQLLIKHGKNALPLLNGMFAFALWDSVQQELLCARDRFGIKPFYYASSQGRFALASELKSLLVLPWIDRAVNLHSIYHFMSLMYVPGIDTAVSGIFRLSAASWLTVSATTGVVNQGVWWTPKIGGSAAITRNDACAQIRAGFEAAVTSWSSSDVPIACSLSGGLDSSAIVGLLANQGHRLRTYSVGFTGQAEAAWNELPLARLVAQRWGTNHEEIVLDPISLLDDLLQMVWHLDEPYGGGLPSWAVFKGMSGVVKVGMTGTGGDELFGNYGKWREVEGGPAWRWFCGQHADLARFRCKFFNRYYYLNDEAKHRWVFQHEAHGFDTAAWMYESVFQRRPNGNLRDRIAGVDLETQLPEEFLMMTDRFSMAHSVEARTPFLDNQFADLVLGLPASLRTHRSDLKGLLRDSIADLLPPQLIHAPKRGFVIPLTLWLRGTLKPLVEKLLAPDRLASQGIFRPEFYAKYVRPHVQGQANFTQIVWAALMFQLWHMVFIEGAGVKPTYAIADLVKS